MRVRVGVLLQRLANAAGFNISRRNRIPPDLDEATIETIHAVRPFTATSPERVAALCQAVSYLVKNDISGDIVECGVWKGGSMMAVGRTLGQLGDRTRNLHLLTPSREWLLQGPMIGFATGLRQPTSTRSKREMGVVLGESGRCQVGDVVTGLSHRSDPIRDREGGRHVA